MTHDRRSVWHLIQAAEADSRPFLHQQQ